jgi:predicted lipid-binding transport protein (Tim44 family)
LEKMMLTRLSAAIVGLLAFAGCIIVGLVAGNPFETIILRALGGLLAGMVLGLAVGWLAQRVVEEQFRKMVSADIAEETHRAAQAKAQADAQAGGADEPRADTAAGAGAPAATVTASDGVETLASRAARELIPELRTPAETAVPR